VPDCDLGMFVTTNATGGVEALTALVPGFFDRFLPGDTTPAQAVTTAAPQAGFYAPARHNESTMEKILVLLGPQRLKVNGDGTVHFKGKDWTPRPDGLYTAADGSDHLVSFTGTHNRRYVATDGPTYQLFGDVSDFLYGAPLGFRLLLGVPVIVVVLGIGALVGTVRGWRGAGRLVRGHQVTLLIGPAALGWFLW
jgi:hypothetical protein